jgi:hypothetical protein
MPVAETLDTVFIFTRLIAPEDLIAFSRGESLKTFMVRDCDGLDM